MPPSEVSNEILGRETLDLAKLAEALMAHPSLYWHPLVQHEIGYLHQLTYEPKEWARLGWRMTEQDGVAYPPNEVEAVYAQLEKLVEAHASGLFPGRRITWTWDRKRSGPKALLKNPHPTGEPWTEWVQVAWLDRDERALRKFFRERQGELRSKPDEILHRDNAKARIEALARNALEVTEAGWWSGWKERVYEGESSKPSQPPQGASEATAAGRLVRSFVERWQPLQLDDAIEKMLTRRMGRAGRDGKPAYLAYAVLGALLGVAPEKIRNVLDSYRHPRRRRPTLAT